MPPRRARGTNRRVCCYVVGVVNPRSKSRTGQIAQDVFQSGIGTTSDQPDPQCGTGDRGSTALGSKSISADREWGLSPMTYLRGMRAERMARLLASSDLSVAAVARSVGWTDVHYASRCFRAHYGVSPTEFRRQQSA